MAHRVGEHAHLETGRLEVHGEVAGALAQGVDQGVVATASVNMSNPSRVVVSVHKTGGGAGNDVAGSSATIVTLTFNAKTAGTSTWAI